MSSEVKQSIFPTFDRIFRGSLSTDSPLLKSESKEPRNGDDKNVSARITTGSKRKRLRRDSESHESESPSAKSARVMNTTNPSARHSQTVLESKETSRRITRSAAAAANAEPKSTPSQSRTRLQSSPVAMLSDDIARPVQHAGDHNPILMLQRSVSLPAENVSLSLDEERDANIIRNKQLLAPLTVACAKWKYVPKTWRRLVARKTCGPGPLKSSYHKARDANGVYEKQLLRSLKLDDSDCDEPSSSDSEESDGDTYFPSSNGDE